jgi:hypothetical protein
VSAAVENWLWHSFGDLTREYACAAVVASVIMCGVRS